MLIVNADDFGRSVATTDNIVACFNECRITSTSAMVFMADSERASRLSAEHSLDVGLHLNFDEEFTGAAPTDLLKDYQGRVARFLTKNKYNQLMFNPMLIKEFEYLYAKQYEEFVRLYGRPPSHINGHHHMHLCSNVLLGDIIPHGSRVRRSFTFWKGERHIANRLYRRFVDAIVERRFSSTDMFFAATPFDDPNSLKRKVELSKRHNVELMVHLNSQKDLEYLMQKEFGETIREAPLGTFGELRGKWSSNKDVQQGLPVNR